MGQSEEDEVKYECAICGKEYTSMNACHTHMRMEHGEVIKAMTRKGYKDVN